MSLGSKDNSRVLLVPAAGFGRRVGSPEAKEMMLRPPGASLAGARMIHLAMQVAQKTDSRAHVITRKDKKFLIEYLEKLRSDRKYFAQNLYIQFVEETKEWPETVLKSEPHWGDQNIVFLPDMDLAPLSATSEMFQLLERGSSICFATFVASTYRTWGAVDFASNSHCEKPNKWSDATRAWGLFGFRRKCGGPLLANMLESTFDNEWRPLPSKTSEIKLDYFRDLTR